MIKKSIFILPTILFIMLLTGCNNRQEQVDIKSLFKPSKNLMKTMLVGKWKYYNTIWYEAELLLEENGSFFFHDRSCMEQCYTAGIWKRNGQKISFQSSDKYFKHTNAQFASAQDTTNIYFNNVQFRFEKDSLYSLQQTSYLGKAEFYKE